MNPRSGRSGGSSRHCVNMDVTAFILGIMLTAHIVGKCNPGKEKSGTAGFPFSGF